jgi:hypothetical protein
MNIAITIRNPWAWATVQGFRAIHNECFNSNYRGKLLIHSSAIKPSRIYPFPQDKNIIIPDELIYGAIIGEVILVDIVKNHTSKWAIRNQWHWVLEEAKQYENPIYCDDRIGLWEYNPRLQVEQLSLL